MKYERKRRKKKKTHLFHSLCYSNGNNSCALQLTWNENERHKKNYVPFTIAQRSGFGLAGIVLAKCYLTGYDDDVCMYVYV